MGLLDKIKSMFSKGNLPEETKLLLSGVADVIELRKGLDEIVTRNEVEGRDIEREIEKLAKMEIAQKERIAGGDMNRREKTNTLREIQRLRRRMTSLEKRHRIHQDNIDLHLGLFDRITEMEAMELKRVTQDQIEEISVDYDERVEKHRDMMHAARAAAGLEGNYTDSREEAELAALEREILAEAGVDPDAKEEEQPADEEAEAEAEDEDEAPPAEEKPKVEEQPEEPAAPKRKPIEQAMAELETAKTEDDEPALEVE